jgi:hypothetical protein
VLQLEDLVDETNKSIVEIGSKPEIKTLNFDELENKFWDNHYKLKKIKRTDPEYDEILDEDDTIVEQIHLINHQG